MQHPVRFLHLLPQSSCHLPRHQFYQAPVPERHILSLDSSICKCQLLTANDNLLVVCTHPGLNAIMTACSHHAIFKSFYICSCTETDSPQVDNGIQDYLSRSMKSGFPSPSSLMYVNTLLLEAGCGYLEMCRLATFTQSVDTGVLHR